jgi:stage V sporulation protein S
MDMIKVSSNSRTAAVAGAIAGIVREHHRAEVQAIGAGAVNQAMKALILATGYLKNDGIFVTCVPEFADVNIENKVKTAIKLVVEPTSKSSFDSIVYPMRSVRADLPRV